MHHRLCLRFQFGYPHNFSLIFRHNVVKRSAYYRRRSSSITKWVARISQERVNLESPDFARASFTPTHSTAAADTTSLARSFRAQTVENTGSDGFRWNFENSLSEDHDILHIYRRQLSCLTKPVGCKTGAARHNQIIRPLFNLESPNFAWHPRRPSLQSHRIWPAKNAASSGFWSNFNGVAFCLARPIGGLHV